MSSFTLKTLTFWLISTLTLSTVTALPQNTEVDANTNDANDNEIVIHINEGPYRFPITEGTLTMTVNGSDGRTSIVNTMNHRFESGPITVYKAKIIRAPTDYGCYFWTPESTGATTSFRNSGNPPSSSSSSGVSAPASSVSQTFYSDSPGLAVENAFLDGESLTCFPLDVLQGSVSGSGQITYDTIGIFISILVPLNPNFPANPSTGNAKLLVAPFIPVRVEPISASQGVNDLNNNSESSDGKVEGEEEYRMVGSLSFPDEIIFLRAAIVHVPNPDARCQILAPERLGNEKKAEFSADAPLQGYFTDITTVKCFY